MAIKKNKNRKDCNLVNNSYYFGEYIRVLVNKNGEDINLYSLTSKDFPHGVLAWVQKEENVQDNVQFNHIPDLSLEFLPIICENAIVKNNVKIKGGNILIAGNAVVEENVCIIGIKKPKKRLWNTEINGNSIISGKAKIEHSVICRNVMITGDVKVKKSNICGNIVIEDDSYIKDSLVTNFDLSSKSVLKIENEVRIVSSRIDCQGILSGNIEILNIFMNKEISFNGKSRVTSIFQLKKERALKEKQLEEELLKEKELAARDDVKDCNDDYWGEARDVGAGWNHDF